MKLNCCDGAYNSIDVHFTSACDNKCAHCIDTRYYGTGIVKPDVDAICKTIIDNSHDYDDVLFLGGEPCLYLGDLLSCVWELKRKTKLKLFVTTSVPKICHDQRWAFEALIECLDGINLSVQHYREDVADAIRCTKSAYDRQAFYASLPHKEKIRINLNIVKPFLYNKEDITNCLAHYEMMGFNETKLSEIQHGKEHFVSFEKVFGLKLGSPFYHGCQTHVELPFLRKPLLLKRSCFMCEETLTASAKDAVKVLYRVLHKPRNHYGVVYEDGSLSQGWH